jgi:beta-glucosidase
MQREPWEVTYEEDIYVGYRYYSTFKVPVSYEFGYGKSYTSFEYSNSKISNDEFTNEISISVKVKNTGKVAGKEVVQIYVSAPGKKLEKPAQELVAFGKTKVLAPGESQTLNFTITKNDMVSFDELNSLWIIESGKYSLKVAASSADIKSELNFSVARDIVVSKVNKALVPQVEINRLRKNK